MRLLLSIALALLLVPVANAGTYKRWWEYESQLRGITPQQLQMAQDLAANGDADSAMLLAAGYQKGIALPKDISQFDHWLIVAAQNGQPEAQETLAECYVKGNAALPADAEQSLHWQRAAAENGHMVAQFNLANTLLDGRGAKKDLAQSLRWLQKSAEAGFTHAQFFLGDSYASGQPFGIQDNGLAEMWLVKAANLGHPIAAVSLARLYSESDGVPRDPKLVETLLVRGAEQGRADAQFQLATLYRRGWLGRIDLASAMEWYELAAKPKKHYAPAAFELGQLYAKGDGVTQDPTKALAYYTKAAEDGMSDAMYQLGEMYRSGALTGQDNYLAYKWFSVGALMGAADCTSAQKRLSSELKPEQIEAAKIEAREWLDRNPKGKRQVPGKFEYFSNIMVPDDPPSDRGPSTEDERKKAVQLVHQLEVAPIGDGAHEARVWLNVWTAGIPDIYFINCNFLMEHPESDYPYRRVLYYQLQFGGDVYLVEHPDKSNKQLEIYQAALISTLSAYRSILAAHPEARWPLLDEMIERGSNGALFDAMHARVNQYCR